MPENDENAGILKKLCSDMRRLFGGRNLVVTYDDKGYAIIPTGIGIKYDTKKKRKLEQNLTAFLNKLPSCPSNSYQRDVKIYDFADLVPLSKENEGTIKRLKELQDDAQQQIIRDNLRDLIYGGTDSSKQRDLCKTIMGIIFDGIENIISQHLGATYEAKITALLILSTLEGYYLQNEEQAEEALKKITNKTTEKKYDDTSLSGLFSDDVMKLSSALQKNDEKSLGDMLHSELFYTLWLGQNSQNPSNVFFTQRDMCDDCAPHVVFSASILNQTESDTNVPNMNLQTQATSSKPDLTSKNSNASIKNKNSKKSKSTKNVTDNLINSVVLDLEEFANLENPNKLEGLKKSR